MAWAARYLAMLAVGNYCYKFLLQITILILIYKWLMNTHAVLSSSSSDLGYEIVNSTKFNTKTFQKFCEKVVKKYQLEPGEWVMHLLIPQYFNLDLYKYLVVKLFNFPYSWA